MAQVAIDDEANELLDKYVDESELGATKKDVASAAIKRFVRGELDD